MASIETGTVTESSDCSGEAVTRRTAPSSITLFLPADDKLDWAIVWAGVLYGRKLCVKIGCGHSSISCRIILTPLAISFAHALKHHVERQLAVPCRLHPASRIERVGTALLATRTVAEPHRP